MGTVLNDIFSNFERLAAEQGQIEKSSFDTSQFDLLTPSTDTAPSAKYLDSAILVGGDSGEVFSTQAKHKEISLDTSTIKQASLSALAEDKKNLLEKKHPFGLDGAKDIIETAHPERVQVAEGPKESGVVDNLNEQQKKIVNMINKMPTGNVTHNFSFASEINELVVLANQLDELHLFEEADELTKVAYSLSNIKKKTLIDELPSNYFVVNSSLVRTAAFLDAVRRLFSGKHGKILTDKAKFQKKINDHLSDIQDLDAHIQRPGARDVASLIKERTQKKEQLAALEEQFTKFNEGLGFLGTLLEGGSFVSAISSAFRGAGAAAGTAGTAAATGLRIPGPIQLKLAAALALALAGSAAYIFTGVQENIDTDVADFQEDIEEELSDAKGPAKNTLEDINKLVSIYKQMASKMSSLQPTPEGAQIYYQFASSTPSILKQIEALLNNYYTQQGSILPGIISDLDLKNSFSALKESHDEILETQKDVLESFGEKLDQAKMQAAAPTPYGADSSKPDLLKPIDKPKYDVEIAKPADSERIIEIQEFLNTLPEELDSRTVTLTGTATPLTKDVLRTYVNYVRERTNVSPDVLNVDIVLKSGDRDKLEDIWEVAKNPGMYIKR